MTKNIKLVGLDVHAATVAIAVAEMVGEVRSLGTVAHEHVGPETIGPLPQRGKRAGEDLASQRKRSAVCGQQQALVGLPLQLCSILVERDSTGKYRLPRPILRS